MSPTGPTVLGYMLIEHMREVGLSIDVVPIEGRWKVFGGYVGIWKGTAVRI
jgi:hypothetical protein